MNGERERIAVAVLVDADEVRGGAGVALLLEETGLDVVALALDDPGFPGDVAFATTRIAAPERTVLAVAVPAGGTPTDLLGAAIAAIAASAAEPRLTRSLLALERDGSVDAVAIGHRLGAWRFDEEEAPLPCIDGGAPSHRAELTGRAANWVRQLVETPPDRLGPTELAEAIARFAALHAPDLTVRVLDGAELERRGFGGTIGVGAGSSRPPRVVELVHPGDGGTPIGLAGKGITFDAGGLDVKQDQVEISWMKTDMAGAAAVAGAVIAAAALGARTPMHAILPLADNVPSGTAQRPGDVVTHPSGTTTEVLDTDCEGRVVLADALDALRLAGVRALIDVGTLTDGGGVGPEMWGAWSTDDALTAAVVRAGDASGDPGWRLPLSRFARAQLGSRVASLTNTPIRGTDSGQIAAAYLRAFTGDVPWLHIDNGSNAYLEEDVAPWPEGPTGSPVRALLDFLLADGAS